MKLQSVEPKTLTPEILEVFGKQNALLTVGDKTKCNTMTIGWAQMGTLWERPVCTIFVRPERYTYEFLESNDYFTVSVLPRDMRKPLAFCGTRSGRDVDKIKECGLTLAYGVGDAPYFEEAEWVLVCRKLYAQDMAGEFVNGDERVLSFYGAHGNWHKMYVGEVVEAYKK
jgi:flavin reductase (DIM6/NTAB) family NADH-FMN oxidoreductase RutF